MERTRADILLGSGVRIFVMRNYTKHLEILPVDSGVPETPILRPILRPTLPRLCHSMDDVKISNTSFSTSDRSSQFQYGGVSALS